MRNIQACFKLAALVLVLTGCTRNIRDSELATMRVDEFASAEMSSGLPDLSKGQYKAHADRHLAPIYAKTPLEVYCGCDVDFATGKVDISGCGYVPVTPGSPHNTIFHWEHVFPKSWVAKAMGCTNSQECKSGSKSAEYNLAENDLYNLVPSVGSLNMKRSDNWLWDVPGEPRAYGKCDFEVTKIGYETIIEPPNRNKGNVARIILYFIEQHGMEIPDEAIALYLKWHRADPVDKAERKRAAAIAEVIGHSNPWVTGDR